MSRNIDKIFGVFLPDYHAKIHVRHIARLSGLNRQTVSGTLKFLEKIRVMDSEKTGKMKYYYMRNSLLARLYTQNAENYRRTELCKRKAVIARLVELLEPSSIAALFGSYATGTERKNSDVDVFIIGRKKPDLETFEKETGKSVQIFLTTRKKFIEGYLKKDTLFAEVARNHICLKNIEAFVDMLWEANYG